MIQQSRLEPLTQTLAFATSPTLSLFDVFFDVLGRVFIYNVARLLTTFAPASLRSNACLHCKKRLQFLSLVVFLSLPAASLLKGVDFELHSRYLQSRS